MGFELKVMKDGQPTTIEVDADSLDAKGMGFLATAEVDDFAARKSNEGAEKARAELTAAIDEERQKAENALRQLEEYKTNLSKKDSEAVALGDRLKNMEAHIESLVKAREDAEANAAANALEKEIVNARSSLSFVEGGAEVFDAYLKTKRQQDGSYLLANGLTGTAEAVAKEWSGTAVGKSLLVTTEKGGGSSAPGSPEESSMSGAEYIKQFGLPAYREMLEKRRVRKSKTA